MFICKQSSEELSGLVNGSIICKQRGPILDASLKPLSGAAGCGGLYLNWPIGGAAYGTFKKVVTCPIDSPLSVPCWNFKSVFEIFSTLTEFLLWRFLDFGTEAVWFLAVTEGKH
jgi:hypothetical protein